MLPVPLIGGDHLVVQSGKRHVAAGSVPGDAYGKGLPLPADVARQCRPGRQLGKLLPQSGDLLGGTGNVGNLLPQLGHLLPQCRVLLPQLEVAGRDGLDGSIGPPSLRVRLGLRGPGLSARGGSGVAQSADGAFLAGELSVPLAQLGAQVEAGAP